MGIDVTPRILETLEMMIASDVYRQGFNPALLDDLTGLLASHNWSPEMQTAIRLLADLRHGNIKCVRDRQTNDY
jgi:hypothetical protein